MTLLRTAAAIAPGWARLASAPRLSWPRALVLLVAFVALFMLLRRELRQGLMLLLLQAIGREELHDIVRGATVTSGAAVVVTVLNALLIVGLLLLLRRFGGPSLADAGLRREPGMGREVLLGLALGLGVFAFVLAVELLLGVARVQLGDLQPLGALYGLLTFAFVALTEELAFRGFLLPVLARAGGVGVGLLGSSLLFGLAHVDNPAASPLAVVGLFTVGLLFAWGYLATSRLWLPMAFHLSWNVAEGPLFGFPVSGLGGETLLRVTAPAPAWLTGGAFGPEAGLLILPACALAAVAIYAWRRANPALPSPIPVDSQHASHRHPPSLEGKRGGGG